MIGNNLYFDDNVPFCIWLKIKNFAFIFRGSEILFKKCLLFTALCKTSFNVLWRYEGSLLIGTANNQIKVITNWKLIYLESISLFGLSIFTSALSGIYQTILFQSELIRGHMNVFISQSQGPPNKCLFLIVISFLGQQLPKISYMLHFFGRIEAITNI